MSDVLSNGALAIGFSLTPTANQEITAEHAIVLPAIVPHAGFSIVICTHDGATRLPAVLARLKVQAPSTAPWEVLLVDSVSTDGAARCGLRGDAPVPLRVVSEAKLGLQHARERGLREALYDFVGFVDDDKWVAADWVKVADETLASDPSLGEVGSICDPIFEVPEPEWFAEFHSIDTILKEVDLERSQDPPEYLHGGGTVPSQASIDAIDFGGLPLLDQRSNRRDFSEAAILN